MPLQCRCGRYLKKDAVKCPKCGRKVRESDRAKIETATTAVKDDGVKVIDGRKLKWIPSVKAHENVKKRYAELSKRLKAGEGFFLATVEQLRPLAKRSRDGCWSTELWVSPSRSSSHDLYVSPKGNRYRLARPNEKAHLIVKSPTSINPNGIRLRKFDPEKATTKKERKHARLVKRHEKKVKVMKRAKSKKSHHKKSH